MGRAYSTNGGDEELLLLFILTSNGYSPGGSGTTIRHNTQITHITQNNTTIKQNTAHKTTHTINTLDRMITTITTTINAYRILVESQKERDH
jgi:hypothetical protein